VVKRRLTEVVLVVLIVVAALSAGRSWIKRRRPPIMHPNPEMASQEQEEEPGAERRGSAPEMVERINLRIREALSVSDPEWDALAPKMDRARALAREIRRSRMRTLSGSGGERREPGQDQGGPSAAEAAAAELSSVLEDADATPEQIAEKMAALRRAREQARQELQQARQELREGLDPRREAALALMGILD